MLQQITTSQSFCSTARSHLKQKFRAKLRKTQNRHLYSQLNKENRFKEIWFNQYDHYLRIQNRYSNNFHFLMGRRYYCSQVEKMHDFTILFGSQTGTANLFSQEAFDKAEESGKDVRLLNLSDYDYENELKNENNVLFVMSCFGKGEPTDDASQFFNWLMETDQDLGNVNYAVFGLGSSNYSDCGRYQAVGKAVENKMDSLGAKKICDRGEGDDANDIDEDWEEWFPSFWEKFSAVSTEVNEEVKESSGDVPLINYVDGVNTTTQPGPPYSIKNPYNSTVESTVQLHTPLSKRSVKHIEFSIKGSGLSYETGDYVGIFPKNQPELVDDLASYLDLNLDAQYEYTSSGYEKISKKFNRVLNNYSSPREMLVNYLDLSKPLRKNIYHSFAQLAEETTDKQKLTDISNLSQSDFLKVSEYKTVLDVLQEFPSLKPDFSQLLNLLPALNPRFYSISSSPKMFPDSVHITTVLNRFTSPAGNHIYGTCSKYLDSLETGEKIPLYISTSQFRLPKDPTTPVIMIGAGTGLAPFIGFLQEKEFQQNNGAKPGKNILFFGCNTVKEDFIYQSLLEEWRDSGLVELNVALWEDEGKFVQHVMKEQKEKLSKLINEEGASVYICGNVAMGNGVAEALADILDGNTHTGQQMLNKLKDLDRYHSDLFA
eukprot:TRINITY_DN5433_c0_g1_i1.p1 TRINITY_DN5433_c0_g1~~TRINITY_DN5433_c0_g1_i1.p1  ORF type:complete len:657 (-),score=142.93 TRINITY_DN5433_c0_g1_i1:339-2309(-)